MKKSLVICLFSCYAINAQIDPLALDSLLLYGKHHDLIQTLKSEPLNNLTLSQLGKVYQDKGDVYNALIHYEKATRTNYSLENRLRLAKLNTLLQCFKIAEELLIHLKKDFPTNEVIEINLAKLYHRQNKFSNSIRIYKNLANKSPSNLDYTYGLGLAYAGDKKFSTAIDTFLDVYKKDSTHFNAIYQLAKSFYELKIPDSTYVFIHKGNQIRPNHKNLNRIHINQLRRDKSYKDAISVLKIQDSLYPDEFFNKKMFGICLYNNDETEAAETFFKEALTINPNDFKSYTYLGHLALKKGNYKEAFLDYFKATITDKSLRDEEYYGMGMASIAMDENKQAYKFLKKAYEENKRNSLVLFELAKITDHITKGGKEAYQYFNEYLNRFPTKNKENNVYVHKRVKEIKESFFLKGVHLE